VSAPYWWLKVFVVIFVLSQMVVLSFLGFVLLCDFMRTICKRSRTRFRKP